MFINIYVYIFVSMIKRTFTRFPPIYRFTALVQFLIEKGSNLSHRRYICMHICICICICIYTYVYIGIDVCIYLCIFVATC
jgi:hypothetical protein